MSQNMNARQIEIQEFTRGSVLLHMPLYFRNLTGNHRTYHILELLCTVPWSVGDTLMPVLSCQRCEDRFPVWEVLRAPKWDWPAGVGPFWPCLQPPAWVTDSTMWLLMRQALLMIKMRQEMWASILDSGSRCRPPSPALRLGKPH